MNREQQRAMFAKKGKLTKAHLVELENAVDKNQRYNDAGEIIGVPKFMGKGFFQKRLKHVKSNVRPEFIVKTRNGKLLDFIVINVRQAYAEKHTSTYVT